MKQLRRRLKADLWKRQGRVPGAYGANAAKWVAIEAGIRATDGRYGWHDAGIDERVVEYAWLFDRMRELDTNRGRVLDAGSVLNHPQILSAWRSARRSPVSIVTLGYEGRADVSDDVRYEFADLRQLPYRDAWFTNTLSLSTLEHVGLDNTIYGSAAGSVAQASDPSSEVRRALAELHRVTVEGGRLLVSVPYGARSNRGWFRILDAGDLEALTGAPGWGNPHVRFFRSRREGWRECTAAEAADAGYNEPSDRAGRQTAPAHVGAAESVALLELTRR